MNKKPNNPQRGNQSKPQSPSDSDPDFTKTKGWDYPEIEEISLTAPVLMVEIDIHPTPNGLKYYSIKGIQEVFQRFFDFKDDTLRREFETARLLLLQDMGLRPEHPFPILAITLIIVGGDICLFSKQKMLKQCRRNFLPGVKLDCNIHEEITYSPKLFIDAILTTERTISEKIDISILEKLEHPKLDIKEVQYIYDNPIFEIPTEELFGLTDFTIDRFKRKHKKR